MQKILQREVDGTFGHIASRSPGDIFLEDDTPQKEEFKERSKMKIKGKLEDVERELKRERVLEVEKDMQFGLFWKDGLNLLKLCYRWMDFSEFRPRTLPS